MGTTLSQPYSHAWDSFYKGMDSQGAFYTCRFLFLGVPWSKSDGIANEIMGLPTRVGGKTTFGAGPMQHPLSPNLYAKEVRIEGLGRPVLNAAGYPQYDDTGFAADVTFRPWGAEGPFQASDDPGNLQAIDQATPILWCTQELDYETERFSIPNHKFQWQTLGKPAGVPITVEVGITVMKLTFHRVPYMPSGPIRSLRGKVNSTTFLGAAAGTVYYRGGRTVRDINPDGSVAQRCEMVFLERDKPWVQFLRNDSMTWDTLVDNLGGKLYTAADLSPLIML